MNLRENYRKKSKSTNCKIGQKSKCHGLLGTYPIMYLWVGGIYMSKIGVVLQLVL